MKLNNKRIAIVGGGPGGLTLARLLQQAGADVKVYERDYNREARLQGSPLDMHEGSGLAALQKAGLMEVFKSRYRPGADKMVITDAQARVMFSDHDSKPAEDFGQAHFRPEIDRGPLRNLLLDSLRPETVVWDSHFLSMEKEDNGWRLHFKNGATAYADLVVAADGANSRIRTYLTDIKAFYTGITMLEGNLHDAVSVAPGVCGLLKGGKIMAFGNGRDLLMGMKGNGDLTFYASFRTGLEWTHNGQTDFSDTIAMLNWFQREYAGWNSVWDELFENATPPFVPRPIYCMPTDQTWNPLPNLTMIGDAAHVMPPFAGEGANMAMLDALELSECLIAGQYDNIHEAIAAYEMSMRQRAAAAAKESLENGERMHSETALEQMLAFFAGH